MDTGHCQPGTAAGKGDAMNHSTATRTRSHRTSCNRHWQVLALIGILLSGTPGYTEEIAASSQRHTDAAIASTTTLTPIEITGERLYEPLKDALVTPANDEPFTVHLDREDIERRKPANAAEALRYIGPNLVYTRQNRKYRNFYDFRGERVSLAIDGTPVQDGSSNGSMRGDDRILDMMGTDQIESIDLIKNSSAMIYGTMRGGLIHIRTREPGPGEHGWMSLGYGTYGTKELRLNFSNRWTERSAFIMTASNYSTDGPDGKNADSQFQNLSLKWFQKFSDKDRLELNLRRDTGGFSIPIDENVRGQVPDKYFYQTWALVKSDEYGWRYDPWTNTLFDLKYDHSWNENQNTELQFSSLNVTNDFYNPRGESSYPAALRTGHTSPHHVIENTTSYGLRHTSKWDHDIITRVGYLYDHWHNPTGKLYWENRDNEDEKYSYYLQGEVPFGRDKWLFDAGYRRDKRYMIREDRFRATGVPVVLEDKWEDPRNNFSTGLTYTPTKHDTIALRYGLIDVSPVDRYATPDGSDLMNEKDKLVNLGYEHAFAHRRNTSIGLNFFTNDKQDALIDNGTQQLADGTFMRIFKNQTTKVKGSEINLKAGLGEKLDLRFGVGQMTYDPDDATRPRLNYNFSLLYTGPRNLEAELYGLYMGETQTSTTVTTGTNLAGKPVNTKFPYQNGDYTDLNLVVRKRFTGHSGFGRTVTLAVKNLLDDRYETTSASNLFSPVHGRTVQVNFDFDF